MLLYRIILCSLKCFLQFFLLFVAIVYGHKGLIQDSHEKEDLGIPYMYLKNEMLFPMTGKSMK